MIRGSFGLRDRLEKLLNKDNRAAKVGGEEETVDQESRFDGTKIGSANEKMQNDDKNIPVVELLGCIA
ncbi:uncharacterized protein N7477_004324 [Penicillium maclennaniae]|uniref:uncharacterized protein n=1 Tax=Penicillium maclennaniae TaxID=1343394 RepID=UPI0025420EEA|nr:uncharacterized protein N7477_004324 [Penicillium maclennaniae]KAJ5674390.1 hypothetical protein N7477_004324 [Penicillium maclennaniae]